MERKILIVDDHPIYLIGIRRLLEQQGFGNISVAQDGSDALQQLIRNPPDMLILDLGLPLVSGWEILAWIRQRPLEMKVVVLSVSSDYHVFELWQKEIIHGYVLKEESFESFIEAVGVVCKGHKYISPLFKAQLQQQLEVSDLPARLSSSELRIVSFIAEDLSTRQISEQLAVSPKTVENQRNRIAQKIEALNPNRLKLKTWIKEHFHKMNFGIGKPVTDAQEERGGGAL